MAITPARKVAVLRLTAGKKAKEARTTKGMSLNEMARKIRINVQSLVDVEKGRVASADVYRRYAIGVAMSTNELFGELLYAMGLATDNRGDTGPRPWSATKPATKTVTKSATRSRTSMPHTIAARLQGGAYDGAIVILLNPTTAQRVRTQHVLLVGKVGPLDAVYALRAAASDIQNKKR